MFKNKNLLVTGGTGSFGKVVIERFLKSDLNEIKIFSRDEKKQDDLRKKYNHSKLKFYLGDVRDKNSLKNAVMDTDFIFHAAALKQVPSCEFFPLEAVKTNILGTENLLDSAIEHGVKRVVCLSTDKAVYPINSMGISKAMMEKVVIAKSRTAKNTNICITRYGNVMASRGSVIPLFINQIHNNVPLTITEPKMTRFMMTLNDAVDLVMYAFKNSLPGDIFVQKAPAASIKILSEAILQLMSKEDYDQKIMGTRHGEKLYESLLSQEEMAAAEDLGEYFRVPPDSRDLNYEKYIEKGEKNISTSKEYNSHNTEQLDVKSMKELLMKVEFVQNSVSNLTDS
jgi:UDP-N-acetylglucosamine 4,6-dehydratase/5-epimerase